MKTKDTAAFTLIELAIVMVVIGLIVGGIIAGQSLSRASQVRSIGTDLTNYASAVQQFRTEFRGPPGDINNATSFWGVAGGAGTGIDAACYSTDESTGTATCNGTGDGDLELANPAVGSSDGTEGYLAWKHLNNAGLVAGVYSGKTTNAGGYGTAGGVNTPKGKIDASSYVLRGNIQCQATGGHNFYTGCYGLLLYFGADGANKYSADLLTTDEMYNLDKKMDDGLPGLGQLRDMASDTTCSSDANTYLISATGINCFGMFGIDVIR